MGTITFDTLEATRRLREAGFNESQAEAVIRVLALAHEKLITRDYFDNRIDSLEKGLTIKLGSMIGVAVAMAAALSKLL